MSKVLDTSNLLDAGSALVSADKLPIAEFSVLANAVVNAQVALAERIATAGGVTHIETSNQPGFGGLCSTFKPGMTGQTCDIIGDEDESGSWND